MDRIPYGEARLYHGKLIGVRVIMAIMHVPVVELLCQVVTGSI
jgi:hypothetical protein